MIPTESFVCRVLPWKQQDVSDKEPLRNHQQISPNVSTLGAELELIQHKMQLYIYLFQKESWLTIGISLSKICSTIVITRFFHSVCLPSHEIWHRFAISIYKAAAKRGSSKSSFSCVRPEVRCIQITSKFLHLQWRLGFHTKGSVWELLEDVIFFPYYLYYNWQGPFISSPA